MFWLNVTSESMASNISNFESRFHRVDWIIPMAVHAMLIVATIWIFLALIIYGINTKKWCSKQKCKSEEMNTGLIYTTVVGCAFMCLVFLAANVAYINVGFQEGEDELCDSMSDSVFALYSLVLLCVFTFLWLRQRVFYNNFLLNLEHSKCLRVFSSLSIFLIVIPGIAVITFTAIPNDNASSMQGCCYKPNGELVEAYWISTVFLLVFGQLSLVILFVYALKKTSGEALTNGQFWCCFRPSIRKKPSVSVPRKKGKHIRSISYSSSGTENSSYPRSLSTTSHAKEDQSKVVQRILWKTLIFASVSMVFDIFIQVVIFILTKPNQHRRISATVVAVSALLNVLFLILSFVSFKEILVSPWTSIRNKCCKWQKDELDSAI